MRYENKVGPAKTPGPVNVKVADNNKVCSYPKIGWI